MNDKAVEDFCSLWAIFNVWSKNQHDENHHNPTCINLTLTNRPGSFFLLFETGISDFHFLIDTQLKIGFQKLPINYDVSRLQKIWQC